MPPTRAHGCFGPPGAEAWPIQAVDAADHGPRPGAGDALVLLSHRGTKRYTNTVLERARADGAETVVISGRGAPGADIETSDPETSAAFTASHLGALMRVAQIAVALGADLGRLEQVPDAGRGRARCAGPRSRPAGAAARVRGCGAEPVDGGRGRAQGARDVLRRDRGALGRAAPAWPVGGAPGGRHAGGAQRRRARRGPAARDRPPGRGVRRPRPHDRGHLPVGAALDLPAHNGGAADRARPAPSRWGRTPTRSAATCPVVPKPSARSSSNRAAAWQRARSGRRRRRRRRAGRTGSDPRRAPAAPSRPR